ncbi:MAG: ATP-binding protein [Clostridia bacterium]|nr:ATP-binding protein [Clostridia bacterium]
MNNQVFQQVLNALAQRRHQDEREEERRRLEVIAQCPRIGQLMDARREAVMKSVYSAFAAPAEENLAEKVAQWNADIKALLIRGGFPQDYLDPVFTCPLCEDTGYTGEGKKELCTCARALYAGLLEKESSFESQQDFAHFDLSVFPADVPVDKKGRTQREQLRVFRDYCEAFADALPHPDKKTLLFYGGSGLGKTYLLRCIHERARERDIASLCVTANQLIRTARKAMFSREQEEMDALFETELLLIDDLGTEPLIENVTVEELFNIINERQNAGLCTVISTNLSLENLQSRYTERVISRLLNRQTCQSLHFEGVDIRRL